MTQSPEAQGLRMLYFANYYLALRSFDRDGRWHDAGDHAAHRLIKERMGMIVDEVANAAKGSIAVGRAQ